MTEDYSAFFDVVDWCEKIKHEYPPEAAIEKISERLQSAAPGQETVALKQQLAWLFQYTGNLPNARKELEEIVATQPADAMSHAILASHFFYHEEDPKAALEVTLEAEKAANRSGHFRRHVQAEKARIALVLDDYELLNLSISNITEIEILSGNRDVGRERDFFDQADKSRLKPEVIEAFEISWKRSQKSNFAK